jgi:hypothetical protein
MSDTLQPTYGDNSLRYAMVITASIGTFGLLALYLGGKRLPGDLEKNVQSDAAC